MPALSPLQGQSKPPAKPVVVIYAGRSASLLSMTVPVNGFIDKNPGDILKKGYCIFSGNTPDCLDSFDGENGMKHYKKLMSALGDAMPMCLAWRLTGTEDNYFNARDLFGFALSDDKGEGSLKEGQFYVVSAEGAIGIASGYEYLLRWLFIPLEGEVYEREVQRLKAELEHDAQPEPAPQPAWQQTAQTQGAPQQTWQQAPQPQGAAQQAWQQAAQAQGTAPQAWQQAPQPQAAPQQAWQQAARAQGAAPQAPQQTVRQGGWQPQPAQQPAPQQQSFQQRPVQQQSGSQPEGMAGRTAPRFCRNCGAPIHAGAKFCQGCGTPVSR